MSLRAAVQCVHVPAGAAKDIRMVQKEGKEVGGCILIRFTKYEPLTNSLCLCRRERAAPRAAGGERVL